MSLAFPSIPHPSRKSRPRATRRLEAAGRWLADCSRPSFCFLSIGGKKIDYSKLEQPDEDEDEEDEVSPTRARVATARGSLTVSLHSYSFSLRLPPPPLAPLSNLLPSAMSSRHHPGRAGAGRGSRGAGRGIGRRGRRRGVNRLHVVTPTHSYPVSRFQTHRLKPSPVLPPPEEEPHPSSLYSLPL